MMSGEELILDIWDKLAIVAAAMLLLFFVLLLVVCIVTPDCWLNQFCPCTDGDDLREYDVTVSYLRHLLVNRQCWLNQFCPCTDGGD